MKHGNEERKKLIEDPGMSWRRWARFVLLRYWYFFISFFIDMAVPLQYLENYELNGGKTAYYEYIGSLASLPFLIAIELLIYKKLFNDEEYYE